MKSVLISIQPKWCAKIASGEKTIEVRKTKPKLGTPFKAYIYSTLPPREELFTHGSFREYASELIRLQDGRIVYDYGMRLCCDIENRPYSQDNFLCQKVIGEFVCDKVYLRNCDLHDYDTITLEELSEQSCVGEDDLLKYADRGHLYGWHISDLVIYDKPKELCDFHKPCAEIENCWNKAFKEAGHCLDKCFDCGCRIKRPPQSWCYVQGGRRYGK